MATRVPTTGFEINTRIFQNVFIGLLLVLVGVGLGSALDSGRTEAASQSNLGEAGLAPSAPVAAQTARLTALSGSFVVPEHGAFTAMQYRDSSVVEQRFAGQDANLDPDVVTLGRGSDNQAYADLYSYGDPSAVVTLGRGSDNQAYADLYSYGDPSAVVTLGRGSDNQAYADLYSYGDSSAVVTLGRGSDNQAYADLYSYGDPSAGYRTTFAEHGEFTPMVTRTTSAIPFRWAGNGVESN